MERYYTPCWRPGCGSAKSHLLEKVPECVHVEVEVDYPDLVYPQKLPQLLAGVKSEWVYKNTLGTCLNIPVKTLEDTYRDLITATIRELAKLVEGSTLAVTEVTHTK